MDSNFRSLREVVNFNNRYFAKVVELAAERIKRENAALPLDLGERLATELTSAYAQLEQNPAVSDQLSLRQGRG